MLATRSSKVASWLPEHPDLLPFYDGVIEFIQNHINSTIPRDEYKNEKSIVDPILGYIHLYPWEIALLDTKLFQRLRKIRQLGLAYQVFPTVGYSRFEHTLGVMGRLSSVLNKLIENHSRTNMEVAVLQSIIDEYKVPIRLAGLFHDAGHFLFSHVSERVVTELPGRAKYPSAQRIQALYTEHFGKQNPISLAEILSVTFLGTPQIRDFLNETVIPNKTRDKINDWVYQAAMFILGLPIPHKAETIFLAQLISSGLDVDKLDYMAREAFFSGIKLELDIDRILDKIRVFKLDAAKLPKRLESFKRLFKAGDPLYVLGLARGGQFAFEEFCISRVALYEKIYLHHKIRAAEAQLSVYLRRIAAKFPEFNEVHRWLYLHDSQIEHPHAELPVPAPESLGPLFDENLPRRDLIGLSFEDIVNRNLMYRAFAFGPAVSLSDPVLGTLAEALPLESTSLVLVQEIKKNPEDFRQNILVELKRITDLLDEQQYPEDIENKLLIDTPRYSDVQQGHETIYFEKPTRLPLRWIMPIDKIVEYYTHNRALGYVFAPKAECAIVMLACEKALWNMHEATFVQEGSISGEIVMTAERLRQTLSDKGYYDDAPPLKPIPEYLLSAEAQEIIQQICKNLNQFKSQNGQQVTVSHLTTFVSQFPPNILDSALIFLQNIEMIDEDTCKEAIEEALKDPRFVKGKRIILAPLGSLKDSAGRLLYSLREFEVDILTDATVRNADYLVFFDDNVNSGLQTLNIFADWLGVNLPDECNLHEEHVQPLNEDATARLRTLSLTLIFAVGTEGADERIKTYFVKYLNIDPANLHIYIHRRLPNEKKVFTGTRSKFQDTKKNELRDFLDNLGEKLLRAEGKSEDTAKQRALGYSGAEAMIVFPYNVPTMTITSLWCRCRTDEVPWMPLVERRRRTKADGSLEGEDK